MLLPTLSLFLLPVLCTASTMMHRRDDVANATNDIEDITNDNVNSSSVSAGLASIDLAAGHVELPVVQKNGRAYSGVAFTEVTQQFGHKENVRDIPTVIRWFTNYGFGITTQALNERIILGSKLYWDLAEWSQVRISLDVVSTEDQHLTYGDIGPIFEDVSNIFNNQWVDHTQQSSIIKIVDVKSGRQMATVGLACSSGQPINLGVSPLRLEGRYYPGRPLPKAQVLQGLDSLIKVYDDNVKEGWDVAINRGFYKNQDLGKDLDLGFFYYVHDRLQPNIYQHDIRDNFQAFRDWVEEQETCLMMQLEIFLDVQTQARKVGDIYFHDRRYQIPSSYRVSGTFDNSTIDGGIALGSNNLTTSPFETNGVPVGLPLPSQMAVS